MATTKRKKPRTAAQKAATELEAPSVFLICDTHGRVAWRFDVSCAACGRRYQRRSEKEPAFAPEHCACGRRLLPSGRGASDGTMRPVCASCAGGGA